MRANAAVVAPGNADAADIPAAPWPGRAAIGAQALVVRLGVERDDANAAQIGQLSRDLPIRLRPWVCHDGPSMILRSRASASRSTGMSSDFKKTARGVLIQIGFGVDEIQCCEQAHPHDGRDLANDREPQETEWRIERRAGGDFSLPDFSTVTEPHAVHSTRAGARKTTCPTGQRVFTCFPSFFSSRRCAELSSILPLRLRYTSTLSPAGSHRGDCRELQAARRRSRRKSTPALPTRRG